MTWHLACMQSTRDDWPSSPGCSSHCDTDAGCAHACETPSIQPLPSCPPLPAGFVQRRWVWVALFAPLWGTLFVNFGIGPVVSRTPDLLPLLGNLAGFAAAAAAVGFSPQVARAAGLTTDEDAA